jgi:hypothetical protein
VSLYSRLFRYRARSDREPLEDFLSEALADLLTRMPRATLSNMLEHAFDGRLPTPLSEVIEGADLHWRTQVPANGGIADLVLFAASKPILLIENKTWSGFQDHSTEEEEANQLTTYCRWLAEKAAIPSACAVLLITGTTSFPDGYHREDGKYAVDCRGQITWAALGRWLNKVLLSDEDRESAWKQLAQELVVFLGEKNLSSEIFTASDLSAAHLFLPTKERWNATFSTIWDSSEHLWRPFLGARVSPLDLNGEAGIIWQWRYAIAEIAPPKTWLGLGIRFPDQADWYVDIGLPDSPHFYFVIGNDYEGLEHTSALPAGWLRNDGDEEFLTYLSVADLPTNIDQRIEKLSEWSKRVMPECEAIMRSAKG